MFAGLFSTLTACYLENRVRAGQFMRLTLRQRGRRLLRATATQAGKSGALGKVTREIQFIGNSIAISVSTFSDATSGSGRPRNEKIFRCEIPSITERGDGKQLYDRAAAEMRRRHTGKFSRSSGDRTQMLHRKVETDIAIEFPDKLDLPGNLPEALQTCRLESLSRAKAAGPAGVK